MAIDDNTFNAIMTNPFVDNTQQKADIVLPEYNNSKRRAEQASHSSKHLYNTKQKS